MLEKDERREDRRKKGGGRGEKERQHTVLRSKRGETERKEWEIKEYADRR